MHALPECFVNETDTKDISYDAMVKDATSLNVRLMKILCLRSYRN